MILILQHIKTLENLGQHFNIVTWRWPCQKLRNCV